MKRIISLLLAVSALCIGLAAAETAAPAVQQTQPIDLSEILVSALGLVSSLLLAWFIKFIAPPLQKWLNARTTAEQRTLLYQLVCQLVNAAEQLIGRGRGSEKLKYVVSALEERGFKADPDMIESAVHEMNEKSLEKIRQTLSTAD